MSWISPNKLAYYTDLLKSIFASKTNAGTVLSSNENFAEIGEWTDGNAGNENRSGYFVMIDENSNGITFVKGAKGANIRGVIVEQPAFASNADSDKYDSTGSLLAKYDYVAWCGLVTVIDNGTCTVNGKCICGDDGTAIPSGNDFGYQVLERVDATHVLIAFEPHIDDLALISEKIKDGAKIELTQAEYDALSEEEKNNGTIYFIPDGESSSVGGGSIAGNTSAIYAAEDGVEVSYIDEENQRKTLKLVSEETVEEAVKKGGGIELTAEEYQALPEEEKMNGAVYLVPDAVPISDDIIEFDVVDGVPEVRFTGDDNTEQTIQLADRKEVEEVVKKGGGTELTAEEYEALPEEEKMNGAVYFVPDAIYVDEDAIEVDVVNDTPSITYTNESSERQTIELADKKELNTFVKGEGIEISVVDGILCVTYDDGIEEGSEE